MTSRVASTPPALRSWFRYTAAVCAIFFLTRSSQAARSDPVQPRVLQGAPQRNENSDYTTLIQQSPLPHPSGAHQDTTAWPNGLDSDRQTAEFGEPQASGRKPHLQLPSHMRTHGDVSGRLASSAWANAGAETPWQREAVHRRLQIYSNDSYCLTAPTNVTCYPCQSTVDEDPCKVILGACVELAHSLDFGTKAVSPGPAREHGFS